ncbi:hypothetical protein ACIOUE_05990 [Streptomyces xanthochromogenes]|uniref:hypothetical protein n=1 Tax=Streptomyces TaxID=1883 RepID=UPI00136BC566|nr:hypothetical protein [Streptomyces sp. SID1034]MYV92546.1 hypothetical protein [Streptomyces sp. SID1034]
MVWTGGMGVLHGLTHTRDEYATPPAARSQTQRAVLPWELPALRSRHSMSDT